MLKSSGLVVLIRRATALLMAVAKKMMQVKVKKTILQLWYGW